jgi:hypothetical protein
MQVEADQIFASSTRLKFLADTQVREMKVDVARKALDVVQDGEEKLSHGGGNGNERQSSNSAQ